MTREPERFKTWAQAKISEIYQSENIIQTYQRLCEKEKSFAAYPKEAFGFEYICLRLAIGCIAWINACRENNISEKAIQNVFLKSVMSSFETPKSLPIASAFSEYLYSPDGIRKNDEIVPLVAKMFERLEAKRAAGKKKIDQKIIESVKTLIAMSESTRMSFENEFLELANS